MLHHHHTPLAGGPPATGVTIATVHLPAPQQAPLPAPEYVVFDRFSPPLPLEVARQSLRGVVGVYAVLDLLPDRELLLDAGIADDDLARQLADPERTFCWAGRAQGILAVSYCAVPGMNLEQWVERRRIARYLRRTFVPACCDSD